MGKLDGQTALVTGASSGIGRAIAHELAGLGAGVILVARRRDKLEELAEEIRKGPGTPVVVEPQDLAEPAAAADLAARVGEAGLDVDILINNAGFGVHGAFLDKGWDRTRSMLQLNMVTLSELTHLLASKMVARGRGHVMNVASIGAYLPVPEFAAYSATKAYVRNFTEALDAELRGTGVRAIVVSPGGTITEFMQAAGDDFSKLGLMVSMSPQRCARIAVAKMLGGRRGVVTGFFNSIGMWMLRWLPRRFMPFVGKHAMGMSLQGD